MNEFATIPNFFCSCPIWIWMQQVRACVSFAATAKRPSCQVPHVHLCAWMLEQLATSIRCVQLRYRPSGVAQRDEDRQQRLQFAPVGKSFTLNSQVSDLITSTFSLHCASH